MLLNVYSGNPARKQLQKNQSKGRPRLRFCGGYEKSRLEWLHKEPF